MRPLPKGTDMTINKNYVIGTLAAIIFIDEAIIGQINKRRFSKLKLAYTAAEQKANYFAQKMDEHKVPFTEFDRIAVDSFYDKV